MKKINVIFDNLHDEAHLYTASKVQLGDRKQTTGIMSHLMAGVSAALPFVIGGGLLMALGSLMVQFGAPNVAPKAGQMASLAWVLNTVGGLGFQKSQIREDIPIDFGFSNYSVRDAIALWPRDLLSLGTWYGVVDGCFAELPAQYSTGNEDCWWVLSRRNVGI